MIAFFNLLSLCLGTAAWSLGLAALFSKRPRPVLTFLSFTCCGASLVSAFFGLRRRITTGDLSAVMDIYPSMAWVTLILLTVTAGLNAIALLRRNP